MQQKAVAPPGAFPSMNDERTTTNDMPLDARRLTKISKGRYNKYERGPADRRLAPISKQLQK